MFLSLDLQALAAKLLRFDAARKVFERPFAVDQAQVNTVADVATGMLFLVESGKTRLFSVIMVFIGIEPRASYRREGAVAHRCTSRMAEGEEHARQARTVRGERRRLTGLSKANCPTSCEPLTTLLRSTPSPNHKFRHGSMGPTVHVSGIQGRQAQFPTLGDEQSEGTFDHSAVAAEMLAAVLTAPDDAGHDATHSQGGCPQHHPRVLGGDIYCHSFSGVVVYDRS